MLDAELRAYKDRALSPLAGWLRPWAHPDALSLLGLGIGVGCAAALYHRAYLLGLGLWLLNRLADGVDGLVARMQQRQSDRGGYLDLLADFLVYALIPVGLGLGHPERAAVLPALVGLLAAFYVNAASWMVLAAILEKRRAASATTAVVIPAGLIEGGETVVFYTLFILFPAHLQPLFLLMTALVAVTVVARAGWAVRRL